MNVLALGLAWLFSAAIAVQDQTPPPIFKAGVELVRLDIRVVDSDGKPVRDLRQDEVEIVERGQRRPVMFFQHIEEPSESYAEIASHTVAGEVSTNQGAARGHLYVLFFDQLHIAPGNEQRARQAAERFVQTRLRPGDRVAIYALPGPGPQIAFTGDRRRLVAELRKVRGIAQAQAFSALGSMTIQEAFEIVRGNQAVQQRVAERLQSQAAPTDTQRRLDASSTGTGAMSLTDLVKEDARRIADLSDGDTRRVLAMLSDVLRPLRGIEGRKSVVLVSEGFYGDRLVREIGGVAGAAAESYSVIYALDLNRRELDITADQPTGGDQAAGIHDRVSSLGTLAAETGGRLILDAGQHADDAFSSLAGQLQDYYLVGFTPRAEALDDRGAYRPVSVRVRRSGARVTARTGFVLTDSAARMDRHQAIERAMSAPFAQRGLPIQYTTYVMRGTTAGLQRVIMSLTTDLPIASHDHPQSGDVVFVVRRATDGHVAASGRDVIALPQQREAYGSVGVGVYRVQFELPAGDYLMRVVVREPGGLVGTADRRFTVRALDGPALTSGDLVLSSRRGELPVRPTAYIGDGLSGVIELNGRTVEQLRDARVMVDLIAVGESAAAASGFADLQEIRATVSGAAREARVELPLQGINPGTYITRARVIVGPDTVAEVTREIEIRSGERAVSAETEIDSRFAPREIVNGAFARDYAASLRARTAAPSSDALRGLDCLAAGDFTAAIAAFEGALESQPSDASAAFFLGWAFHGAGDDARAISAWRRAAHVDPKIVPVHLALADKYVQLAQPALAIQALRAGLAALPESPELRDRLSRLEQQ